MNVFRINIGLCRKWMSIAFLSMCVLLFIFYIIHTIIHGIIVNVLSDLTCEKRRENQAIYNEDDNNNRHHKFQVWIRTKNGKSKHMEHVVNAFKAFDSNIFELSESQKHSSDWNILWSHSYPFKYLRTDFLKLKTTHCINHYPGTGFITNKVTLASSKIRSIPRAFRIPDEKSKLIEFTQKNPDMMFVQKSNNHRGIKIEKIKSMGSSDEVFFVQQFIHNPLLVDGYKFDIGVYTVITSADPLRVYIHDEVLFRYCREKYYPFSPNDTRKYVVGDKYRPTWKVPSLEHSYQDQKLGMRASFDSWLKSENKNPAVVWDKVRESIQNVFYANEDHIIRYSKTYPSHLRFFEIMRFDFIIDDELNVYLMEANMSPNLSSAHFSQNRLLYEQVVFNLLSMVGLSYGGCSSSDSAEEYEMRASERDIVVFHEHCNNYCKDSSSCKKLQCHLCHPCLTKDTIVTLRKAFLEHTWRGSYRRVIPKAITLQEAIIPTDSANLSSQNTLMSEWFRGKCLLDVTFCS